MIKSYLAIVCVFCVFCVGNVEKAWAAETEVVVTTTPAERIEMAGEAASAEATYRAAVSESEKAQALAWAERVKGKPVTRTYVTTPVRVMASAAMTTDGLILAVPGSMIVEVGRIILPSEVEAQRLEDAVARDSVDRQYSRGAYAPAKVVEGAK